MVSHAGTPPVTVRTAPVEPIPNLVNWLDEDAYMISPVACELNTCAAVPSYSACVISVPTETCFNSFAISLFSTRINLMLIRRSVP